MPYVTEKQESVRYLSGRRGLDLPGGQARRADCKPGNNESVSEKGDHFLEFEKEQIADFAVSHILCELKQEP